MPRTKPSKTATKKKVVRRVKKATPSARTVQKKVVKKKEVQPLQASVQPVETKQPESRKFLIGLQFAIAGSAIAVLVLLAAIERNVFATRPSSAASVPATIGLEHTSPLSLSLLFARKDGAGYVSITNGSSEDIHVNLPSNWTRTEVMGTDLKNVTQDIPVFGFSRYALPAGAGMKLLLPNSPSAIFFDSPSSAVAAVDLKTIDLLTSHTDSRVVLVQKQSLVPLWGLSE